MGFGRRTSDDRRENRSGGIEVKIRALLVALAITAAFFAGALYFGAHRTGSGGDTGASLAQQVASLNANFGDNKAADDELIQTIYHLVDRAYYKDINPQIMIKGERTAMLAYLNDALKKKNIRAYYTTGYQRWLDG